MRTGVLSSRGKSVKTDNYSGRLHQERAVICGSLNTGCTNTLVAARLQQRQPRKDRSHTYIHTHTLHVSWLTLLWLLVVSWLLAYDTEWCLDAAVKSAHLTLYIHWHIYTVLNFCQNHQINRCNILLKYFTNSITYVHWQAVINLLEAALSS